MLPNQTIEPMPGITVERTAAPHPQGPRFASPGPRYVLRTTADALLAAGRRFRPDRRNEDALLSLEMSCETSDWIGMSFDRCRTLDTWPEGLALVDRCKVGELPALTSLQRKPAWADDGDEFDRDRLDAGLDDCWRTRRRQRTYAPPVLRLTCGIGGSAKKTPAQLAWGGALAAAVCDAAEGAGYRLEIEGVHSSRGCYGNEGYADKVEVIRLKDAGEPFNLERTVLALACPAFFRWYVMGSGTLAPAAIDSGYGYNAQTPAEFQGDLHVPQCYSYEDARDASRRLMAQIAAMAAGDGLVAAA